MDTLLYPYVEKLKGEAIQACVAFVCCTSSAITLYCMGANGLGCIMLLLIAVFWYVYQLYKKFSTWQNPLPKPVEHIVVNVKNGEPIKIEKPSTVQLLTLGGCVASLIVALCISNYVKNTYVTEAKSDVEKKRNARVAKRWTAFKEMAIFCGLFPLTLMKDMDAITTLITYIVKSYKDAIVIHKMWHNVSTFFCDDDDNVSNNVTVMESMSVEDIISKLSPLIKKEIESGMAREADKIAEKVINGLDTEDEEKYTPLVAQMDKPKVSQDDSPFSDISELPEADIVDNECDIDVTHEGSQLDEQKYIDNTNSLSGVCDVPRFHDEPHGPVSLQMSKIQAVIDRSQTSRHGLGYKGNGRAQLLSKVNSVRSYLSNLFDSVCLSVVTCYFKFYNWRHSTRAVVISLSFVAVSAISFFVYKYFKKPLKVNKESKVTAEVGVNTLYPEGPKQNKQQRRDKYVRNIIKRVFVRFGNKVPREVYDDVKSDIDSFVKRGDKEEFIEQQAVSKLDDYWNNKQQNAWDKDRLGVSGFDARGNFVMRNPNYKTKESKVDTSSLTPVTVNVSLSAQPESKNNKVRPKKWLSRKPKNNWREKLQKEISDTIKAEHLVVGSAICTTPFLYCIEGEDDKGQKCYSTVFPIHHMFAAARHGVSGMKSLNIIQGGKKIPISNIKAVVGKDVIDQVFIPTSNVVPNNVYEFREPVKGELATFFFCLKDGKVRHVPGLVGDPTYIMSNNEKIPVWEWTKSSVNGSCGGVYIAGVDNKIIGFHGVGSPNSKVTPMFYPANENWLRNLNSLSQRPSLNLSDEQNYASNYEKFINGNSLKLEDLNNLNLPGRQ